MRKTIINYTCAFLAIIVLFGTNVYAWWISSYSQSSNIQIQTAFVASTCQVYKGIDFNYDGLLDLTSAGEDYYTEELYKKDKDATEEPTKYLDFNEISADGTVTSRAIIPTEVHTWRIVITNKGDADAEVIMQLNPASTWQDIIKYFSARVNGGEKVYLGTVTDGVFYDIEDPIIVYATYHNDQTNYPSSREFILQFELESYDALVAARVIEDNETNFNAYQALQSETISDLLLLDVILSSIPSNSQS